MDPDGDVGAVTRAIRNEAVERVPLQVLTGFYVLSICLSVFGLWTSLGYALQGWTLDGDAAHAPSLWLGLIEHGAAFLHSFRYTQDNWLLSTFPINALAFMVFGARPEIVFIYGWLVFVAICCTASLIVHRFVSKPIAWVMLPTLLLANATSIGHGGDLGSPVAHNTSAMIGLIALYSALCWVQRRNALTLFVVAAALLPASLSDPWTTAAFSLPLMFAALVTLPFAPAGPARWSLAGLAAVALLVVLLGFSKLTGLFSFLPSTHYVLAGRGTIDFNMMWVGMALGAMFNLAPGLTAFYVAPTVLTVYVVVGLSAMSILSIIHAWRRLPLPSLLLAAMIVISSSAVITAYVLGSISEHRLEVGRFFDNVFVFIPILTSMGIAFQPGVRPTTLRVLASACAILLMVGGPLSMPSAWLRRPAVRSSEVKEIISLLAAHQLTYGYGPYWGSQANAVTWKSAGALTIRPVAFDRNNGSVRQHPVESSPFWYASTATAGQERVFILVAPDPENCPKLLLCRSGAIEQFGPVDEQFTEGDRTVLVWHHRLVIPPP